MNIGQIPAKTARLSPQKTAVIDVPNDRRINYGELDERVRRPMRFDGTVVDQ